MTLFLASKSLTQSVRLKNRTDGALFFAYKNLTQSALFFTYKNTPPPSANFKNPMKNAYEKCLDLCI